MEPAVRKLFLLCEGATYNLGKIIYPHDLFLDFTASCCEAENTEWELQERTNFFYNYWIDDTFCHQCVMTSTASHTLYHKISYLLQYVSSERKLLGNIDGSTDSNINASEEGSVFLELE